MKTGLLGLIVMALLVAPPAARAQTADCEGARPDSLANATPPIYRECDVTRPAERRGREPVLDFNPAPTSLPDERCIQASFTFVVDPAGHVELATIQFQETNFLTYAAAVAKSLPDLRFRPAQLERRPVRQLVVYQRSQATRGVARFGAPFAVGRVSSIEELRAAAGVSQRGVPC